MGTVSDRYDGPIFNFITITQLNLAVLLEKIGFFCEKNYKWRKESKSLLCDVM